MADADIRVWSTTRTAGRIYYGWIVLGLAALAMIGGAAQAMTVFASAVGPLLLALCVGNTGSYATAFYSLAAGVAPLIALQGVVTVQESGRRVGNVHVYGVDERFWQFHGVTPVADVGERDVLVNETLAREIGAQPGAAILVRVPLPSAMPLES